MLSVNELGDRIRDVFPDATQVSDTAVRFTRRDGDRPYAVCHVRDDHLRLSSLFDEAVQFARDPDAGE